MESFADHKSAPTAMQGMGRRVLLMRGDEVGEWRIGEESVNQCLTAV
jgi:hypothetical protein